MTLCVTLSMFLFFLACCSPLLFLRVVVSALKLVLMAGWHEWPNCLYQNTGCSHTQITRLMSACVCVFVWMCVSVCVCACVCKCIAHIVGTLICLYAHIAFLIGTTGKSCNIT